MTAFSASKLLQDYAKGWVTRPGTIARLVRAAANTPPEVIAVELAADWLDDLRIDTASPPAAPEQIVWVESVCVGQDFEWGKRRAEMVRQCFEGSRAWNRFFTAGGRPASDQDAPT